jgi:polyhydroxybutyrate depolymerase
VAGPQTLPFGGTPRRYLLALPPRYDGRSAYPLVLDFHGYGSNGTAQDLNTSMGTKGTARGYIVVTPSSIPPDWNEFSVAGRPDDYGFVGALIVSLESRLCIDPQRVYAAGHSNGSAFAGFLVCKAPYSFAAVAMVSATVPSTCPNGVSPSILAIAGTADPLVPYAGGTVAGSTVVIPAATDTIKSYASKYQCSRGPAPDEPLGGVLRVQYSGCLAGAEVVLDTIVGGSHSWPGGLVATTDPGDSPAGRRFDATATILDYFDRHGAAVATP